MSDWIEWEGGPCPVDKSTVVQLIMLGNKQLTYEYAGDHDWRRGECSSGREIIKYRIRTPQATEPAIRPSIEHRFDSFIRNGKASQVEQSIDDTLNERGNKYGVFSEGAEIMQPLKTIMHTAPGWNNLKPSQKEALEMIQHKIGRILNGDPNYDDNWRDISGYSKLVLDELNGISK